MLKARTLAGFAAALVLISCGGKKPKKVAKVAWREAEQFGASLKVPKDFERGPATGTTSVQYLYQGGLARIDIEKSDLGEGGLPALYEKEYEKRERDTRKSVKARKMKIKPENAYNIISYNKDLKIDGKNAFEVEQEYLSGVGDTTAHDIVVNVDIGDSKLLTVRWHVPDIKEVGVSWDKMYKKYFKESRESFKLK